MRLAAVVQEDGSTVAGLTGGPTIHIWESSGGAPRVIDNPGFTATSARRMVALKAMLAEGVEAVCTPPKAFCAHSYQQAVRRGLRFVPVEPGTSLEGLQGEGETLAGRAVTELPPDLLAESHHHGHGHDHAHHQGP